MQASHWSAAERDMRILCVKTVETGVGEINGTVGFHLHISSGVRDRCTE